MAKSPEQICFASAPVSWGVQDDPGPAWEQPYEQILGEIVSAGFTGAELGPFGYFPTDPGILSEALQRFGLTMLSSFVPVPITEPSRVEKVIEHVRKVSALLSALGARLLVLADCQTPQRREIAGRVPVDGSKSLALGSVEAGGSGDPAGGASCCGFRSPRCFPSPRRHFRRDSHGSGTSIRRPRHNAGRSVS